MFVYNVTALQRTANPLPLPGTAPWVVGTVYSAGSLAAARELRPCVGQGLTRPSIGPDLLELRVDHFACRPDRLDGLTALKPRPFLVTVRHATEGGAADAPQDPAARRQLYERFLPMAAFVDVEVRSLHALAGTVARARAGGVRVVASFHDFRAMPGARRLRDQVTRAVDGGADVFKVAAATERPGDLARLLDFLAGEHRLPLAVMGMGRLGRVSRLALAAAGSVFNYGYLGRRAQVSGQWAAATLRERIDELRQV